MQQLASSAPSSPGSDFAGVLAGLAAPAKKPPQRDRGGLDLGDLDRGGADLSGLDLDSLEDDIATLSYEQALRPGRAPHTPSGPAPDGQGRARQARPGNPVPLPAPEADLAGRSPRPRSRKDASLTIRLTEFEATQLHLRAAEAGLTVSAYLRSCAFEVEALRAEVKSTLAQLRSATSSNHAPRPHGWLWQRIFRRKPRP